jgi:hypothetical protein
MHVLLSGSFSVHVLVHSCSAKGSGSLCFLFQGRDTVCKALLCVRAHRHQRILVLNLGAFQLQTDQPLLGFSPFPPLPVASALLTLPA